MEIKPTGTVNYRGISVPEQTRARAEGASVPLRSARLNAGPHQSAPTASPSSVSVFDRWSARRPFGTLTGSRMQPGAESQLPRYEMIDLSADSPPAGYVQHPVAFGADGTAYVTRGNLLYAVSLDHSVRLLFEAPVDISSAPLITPTGTVYVSTKARELYELRPGQTPRVALKGGWWGAVLNQSGVVFVTAGDTLYAIPPGGVPEPVFTGGGQLWPPGVGMDGTVYAGSSDGCFYALGSDGHADVLIRAPGSWSPPAVTSDGNIYVVSKGRTLHRIPPSGSPSVVHHDDGIWFGDPVTTPTNGVLLATSKYGLLSFSPTEGMRILQEEWIESPTSSPVATMDGTILHPFSRSMLAIRPDGSSEAIRTEAGRFYDATLGPGGNVYVGAHGAKVIIIKPIEYSSEKVNW